MNKKEEPIVYSTTLSWEAEEGVITAPFLKTSTYIYQASQTTLVDSGKASYYFTLDNPGTYVVKGLVNANDSSRNSFYANIDSEPTDPYTVWDITQYTNGFEERTMSWRGNGTADVGEFVPKVFELSAGQHELIVRGKEKETLLDKIWLEKYEPNPPVPQEYTITATAGDGGSIYPSGTVLITENDSIAFSATPDSGYELNNVSIDGNSVGAINPYTFSAVKANHSINANFKSVPTPPPPQSNLFWEAEDGTLTQPFSERSSWDRFWTGDRTRTTYIYQRKETSLNKSGKATYSFHLDEPGTYILKTSVNASGTNKNSFFVNIDSEPKEPNMIWDIIPLTNGFEERTVSWRGTGDENSSEFAPKIFDLSAGNHTIIIRGSDGSTYLDKLWLEKYTSPFDLTTADLTVNKITESTDLSPTTNLDTTTTTKTILNEPVPVDTTTPCTLTNAYWNSTYAEEGTLVGLTLDGENCSGQTANIEVWERDTLSNDPVQVYPNPATFTNNTAQTLWDAVYVTDCDPWCGNPEYFFTASVGNSKIESNNELVVVKKQELAVSGNVEASFSEYGETISESRGYFSIPILLNKPSAQDTVIYFRFYGDATKGSDYSYSSSNVLIPAGTTIGHLTLSIKSDSIAEGEETVKVMISSVENANIGAIATYYLTIRD